MCGANAHDAENDEQRQETHAHYHYDSHADAYSRVKVKQCTAGVEIVLFKSYLLDVDDATEPDALPKRLLCCKYN